jgi:hypothetical protein
VLIPAIKTFRSVGFGNRAQVDWSAASPLETFTELGGTLRAVKAYVDWIEEGDPYLLGASYWAPFDRQLLTRLLPDRARIAYDDDTRVPARQIYAREGAVGASSTGEAYYNFGPLGPAIFGAGLGLLFGLLERRAAASCHVCALLGVTMLIFCFNIRSDWLAVPARFAIGVTLVALCWMWSRGLLWKKPA